MVFNMWVGSFAAITLFYSFLFLSSLSMLWRSVVFFSFYFIFVLFFLHSFIILLFLVVVRVFETIASGSAPDQAAMTPQQKKLAMLLAEKEVLRARVCVYTSMYYSMCV